MKLEEFAGKHVLSGVWQTMCTIGNEVFGEMEAAKCLFILDGLTYEALEDPDDGYRSYMMDDIQLTNDICKVQFPGVKVEIEYKSEGEAYVDGESFAGLMFKDAENGKVILELGTNYADDYYPMCVFYWQPENIHYNDFPRRDIICARKREMNAYEKPEIKPMEPMEPIDIICGLIARSNPILITRHVFPDGDAYGSSRALRDAIRYIFPNKAVWVISKDQNESFNWSGCDDLIEMEWRPDKNCLGIVLDTNNSGRISDDKVLTCPTIVKIDHHLKTYKDDEDYATVEWVDSRRASCSEMVAELIFELVDRYMLEELANKLGDIPESVYKSLYMGMITDTGRFRYPSVNSKTLYTAARVIDKVDTVDLYSNLYVDTIDVFNFKKHMYSRVKHTMRGVSYVIVRKKDLEKFAIKPERVGQFVNIMDCIEGHPIWVAFVETEKGIRASIRSRTIPINLIAEKYSGGGHKNAAGCILPNFSRVEKLLLDLDRLLTEYNAEKGYVR